MSTTSGEGGLFSNTGYCLCCQNEVTFTAYGEWLRDYYICRSCGSKPRERALLNVIKQVFKDLKNLAIHESSPSVGGASAYLARAYSGYVSSHYWEDPELKQAPHLNVDLQNQDLPTESFDLVVAQDVFEHLPYPEKAAKEVHRTLKPGGYFIQTVPLVNAWTETQQRASLNSDGSITWFYEPDFHQNPIDKHGSPVFWHFGYDLAGNLDSWAAFQTLIIKCRDVSLGIDGEYCEVLVSRRLEV